MKFLKLLILFCLLSTCLNAQETRATYQLNGRVKIVETSNYDFIEKFGEIQIGDFNGRKILQFNEAGYIIKKYNINGDRISKDTAEIYTFEYIYNEYKNLRELNEYYQRYRTSNKELKYKTKFKYDSEGRVIEERIYDGSNGSFHKGFSYSYENGKIIKVEIKEDSEDIEMETTIVEYEDESEKLTFKEEYDTLKNWIKRTTFRGGKPIKGDERKIVYFLN